MPDHEPRYNLRHGKYALTSSNSDHLFPKMKWGLIPTSASSTQTEGNTYIAKSETIKERAAYGESRLARRCAVFADGFYTWKESVDNSPVHFYEMDGGKLFALAGIWSPHGVVAQPLNTFAIITTQAINTLYPIYPRMPVILELDEIDEWINCKWWLSSHERYFQPSGKGLKVRRVSTYVLDPESNGPRCIQPYQDDDERDVF